MRKWSAQDLRKAVSERLSGDYTNDVSIRTIYEDLNYMRFELDAPLEDYRDGKFKYFRYSNPDYSIRQNPINGQEISLLKDAVDILRQVSGIQLFEDVHGIISKLESTIVTNTENRADFIQFERSDYVEGVNWVDDCFEAIKGKTVLEISYKPYFKEERKLTIHPYLLKEYRNRWFLIGRSGDHASPTTLALDRISKIKALKADYIENDMFNPDTYYDHVIGVTLLDGVAPELVQIRVSRERVPYVLTKPIHHTQTIISANHDESMDISISVVDNFELRSLLLGFGHGIEVRSPIALRKAMHDLHEAAMNLHNEPESVPSKKTLKSKRG
jgi:predicted DNA-binding transcriptional regulator YafY